MWPHCRGILLQDLIHQPASSLYIHLYHLSSSPKETNTRPTDLLVQPVPKASVARLEWPGDLRDLPRHALRPRHAGAKPRDALGQVRTVDLISKRNTGQAEGSLVW